MTKTITGTAAAWISSAVHDLPDDVHSFGYTSEHLDMSGAGWTRVGKATITVEVPNQDELVQSQVKSLQSEIQNIQAETEVKINRIRDRISKLKALTHD